MSIDYERRWQRASALMQAAGIDAVFVMKPANLAYLSGDGRPCALALLTAAGEYIVSVPDCDRASVEAAARATEVRTFRSEEEMFHGYRDLLADRGLDRATIGLEKNFFDASLHEVFAAHILPNAEVVSATPVLSQLRMCKDDDEIARMRAAARVAAIGMEAAVDAARAGVPEIMVAGEAEYAMRRAGAEGWGIPTYVASGARTAMAHGPASRKLVEPGDVVQIHLSPIVDAYTVEMCRTVFVGEPPPDARRLLDVYLEAVDAGISAAVSGAPLLGIDAALAAVLHDAGLDDAFLRPTFHGVGIEHEEAPIPGGHAVVHGEAAIESVEAGMTLAIGNCGIYRESFGVRNEDTVWVSPDGPVVLTRVVLAGETADSATAH